MSVEMHRHAAHVCELIEALDAFVEYRAEGWIWPFLSEPLSFVGRMVVLEKKSVLVLSNNAE